jgi:hypothetical protein
LRSNNISSFTFWRPFKNWFSSPFLVLSFPISLLKLLCW